MQKRRKKRTKRWTWSGLSLRILLRTAMTPKSTWGHYHLYLDWGSAALLYPNFNPALCQFKFKWKKSFTLLANIIVSSADVSEETLLLFRCELQVQGFELLTAFMLEAVHLLMATWSQVPLMNERMVASEDEQENIPIIQQQWLAVAWPVTRTKRRSKKLNPEQRERMTYWTHTAAKAVLLELGEEGHTFSPLKTQRGVFPVLILIL